LAAAKHLAATKGTTLRALEVQCKTRHLFVATLVVLGERGACWQRLRELAAGGRAAGARDDARAGAPRLAHGGPKALDRRLRLRPIPHASGPQPLANQG
jgi:hypothetical protein